jgi:CRISPR-associated endonuclease/helicase Cas3
LYAALIQGKDFEFAYLVAAHHGKCRIQIKNFHFAPDTIGLHGICEGDRLPVCDLGDGLTLPEIQLDLIDPDDWQNAALDLTKDHGIFRLAYLETVVRIADWRASRLRSIAD